MRTRIIQYSFFFVLMIATSALLAQDAMSYISGSLEANGNAFIRDERIGAANTPQYDHQLYGGEAWFDLRYTNYGFNVGLRFDVFNNSNLLNPLDSYTGEGIGMWYINKTIGKLDVTAGYIYDQIGSGMMFRTYEVRPLLIDNALIGLKLEYELSKDWRIKAFTGRQKQQFEAYRPVVVGGSLEGYFSGGGGEDGRFWSLSPGIGIINRTLDDATVNELVSDLRTYTPEDSVGVNYNTYAFNAFNTLSVGSFTWYAEAAYKSREIFFDPFAEKTNWDGSTSLGKYRSSDGYLLYSSLSYAYSGLGITFDWRQMNSFEFRISPFSQQLQGLMNFIPPMARQNTFRLNARYNAVPQFLGENAFQLDINYSLNRKWNFSFNGSIINDLDNNPLYREVYADFSFKKPRRYTLMGGMQMQLYNQRVYELKGDAGSVQTITPFLDFLYKFSRKNSLRIETQYMYTGSNWTGEVKGRDVYREFGDWVFLQAEFSMAPHWMIFASDMYNVVPEKTEDIHYYSFGVAYTKGANRFTLSWVKQVEGVVCTGGVCRLEPAFNGVRLNVNANF
jgi:hypothetical protein